MVCGNGTVNEEVPDQIRQSDETASLQKRRVHDLVHTGLNNGKILGVLGCFHHVSWRNGLEMVGGCVRVALSLSVFQREPLVEKWHVSCRSLHLRTVGKSVARGGGTRKSPLVKGKVDKNLWSPRVGIFLTERGTNQLLKWIWCRPLGWYWIW